MMSSTDSSFRNYERDDPVFSVDLRSHVDPGIYRLSFVKSRTTLLYGRKNAPKLALTFRIQDMGPFYGVELERWYNVKRLIGKPGKSGRFKVGPGSEFVREYLTLFPAPAKRLDRMSFKPFRSAIITGRVETVTTNSKQQQLPEPLHYSIIRELLEVVGP
jgi:hypothetical protein